MVPDRVFRHVGTVIGGLYTVGQRDLKRLLGYSSTENVGIAGIGFGVGCLGLTWDSPTLVALGFGGGLLHVLNHAFFKCQLFYAAGCVYQIKHVVDMERLGGLFKLMPVTAAMFCHRRRSHFGACRRSTASPASS
jgi:hydrogenase-4 component B